MSSTQMSWSAVPFEVQREINKISTGLRVFRALERHIPLKTGISRCCDIVVVSRRM